jgi:hypothetical protein
MFDAPFVEKALVSSHRQLGCVDVRNSYIGIPHGTTDTLARRLRVHDENGLKRVVSHEVRDTAMDKGAYVRVGIPCRPEPGFGSFRRGCTAPIASATTSRDGSALFVLERDSLCKDQKLFVKVCKWVRVRRRHAVHKNRFEDHARSSRSQMTMIGFCLGGSFFEIRSEDHSGPLCGMPSANTGSPGKGDRSNRKQL